MDTLADRINTCLAGSTPETAPKIAKLLAYIKAEGITEDFAETLDGTDQEELLDDVRFDIWERLEIEGDDQDDDEFNEAFEQFVEAQL
ncbi:hypothetical protein OAL13_00240 [bacterium]|nr:hypothetical protein [bacterium]